MVNAAAPVSVTRSLPVPCPSVSGQAARHRRAALMWNDATVEDAACPLAPRGLDRHRQREPQPMIRPKVRDPRFVTIRRGGTLTDSDHHLLALWAASCAEHVLHLFESAQPGDIRPHRAIELVRAWTSGEITMTDARAAGGHAMAAARDLRGAAR